ncbi:flocculation protein FLO11-like [Penaeus chinensis]|uniref:flocculation protein FLO11-like n=1 Tax=Penaeus chinensis TaxID=139456 RepID=UPI001FB86083|nr:flocculation protein FLO11-like [Penaeus chinensis]
MASSSSLKHRIDDGINKNKSQLYRRLPSSRDVVRPPLSADGRATSSLTHQSCVHSHGDAIRPARFTLLKLRGRFGAASPCRLSGFGYEAVAWASLQDAHHPHETPSQELEPPTGSSQHSAHALHHHPHDPGHTNHGTGQNSFANPQIPSLVKSSSLPSFSFSEESQNPLSFRNDVSVHEQILPVPEPVDSASQRNPDPSSVPILSPLSQNPTTLSLKRDPSVLTQLLSTLKQNPSVASNFLSTLRQNPSAAAVLISSLRENPSIASQIFSVLNQNPSIAAQIPSLVKQEPSPPSQIPEILTQNPSTSSQVLSTPEKNPPNLPKNLIPSTLEVKPSPPPAQLKENPLDPIQVLSTLKPKSSPAPLASPLTQNPLNPAHVLSAVTPRSFARSTPFSPQFQPTPIPFSPPTQSSTTQISLSPSKFSPHPIRFASSRPKFSPTVPQSTPAPESPSSTQFATQFISPPSKFSSPATLSSSAPKLTFPSSKFPTSSNQFLIFL